MSLIEPLESRIAPAAVFTFTDVDGDHVTIKTSTGTNADLASAAHIVGGQLRTLDLSAATSARRPSARSSKALRYLSSPSEMAAVTAM